MRSSCRSGTVLLLLAGCDDPGPSESDSPPEPRCELLETRSPQLGELEPSAEFRVACGNHAPLGSPSIALSADATWVLADGSTAYAETWRLYRIVHGELDELAWVGDNSTFPAVLAGGDDGEVWLFGSSGYSERSLGRARLDPSSARLELESLGSNGWIERVEIAGSTPQLWFSNQDDELMRASIDAQGEWFETHALAVEGVDRWKPRVGLDGAGRQIAYAAKPTPDYATEIWAHDGQTTKLLGSFADLWTLAEPIPTAHPSDVDHEHAAHVERESGVTVLWPDSGDSVSVPWSPSFAEQSCLITSRTVATRTSDGRMWLAWVVYGLPSCNVPASEAPTLRLIEIDPTQRSARERMRLELDHTHLGFSQEFFPSLDVRIAITSHADQLALVIPDGPADQRLHVVQVDVNSD